MIPQVTNEDLAAMPLNSSNAQAVIDGAEAKARELGLPVIVAVLDDGGHLKAFKRMDGAVLGSIDIATRKARTAVLFGAESQAVWDYCKPGAPAPGLELTNGGLAPYGGGIPLRDVGGVLIGALGVSGGSIDQDVAVAQAGFAAFAAQAL
ncbi:GlcG/HbpS family heme-binding protein [Caulobacter endophyticus]|uniref:GlcG/HbpS family heme-binding protein n=1 Tax=Caulobacter endophyticus TaxID=2172652 RepID=UPI00240F4919|nr:heme-binding protein [Caulobacter endophyticus]MDG2527904.1 heme-binding protein [Caulobacter endophyticus]